MPGSTQRSAVVFAPRSPDFWRRPEPGQSGLAHWPRFSRRPPPGWARNAPRRVLGHDRSLRRCAAPARHQISSLAGRKRGGPRSTRAASGLAHPGHATRPAFHQHPGAGVHWASGNSPLHAGRQPAPRPLGHESRQSTRRRSWRGPTGTWRTHSTPPVALDRSARSPAALNAATPELTLADACCLHANGLSDRGEQTRRSSPRLIAERARVRLLPAGSASAT